MFIKSVKNPPILCLRFLISSRSIHATSALKLYSPSALGIDGYLQSRKRIKDQFSNFSDKFRSKMKDFVFEPKNMIFTEDLKNMVHMAEPTDLDLVLNMIKKFNSQNNEFRFALKCFEDPDNNGFFDQQVSYQILLDLLYNHEMYEEMYRVFERVQEKQLNMTKFPKYPLILILAACYKQNTPKSMEYASKIWSEMLSVGTTPVRRAATFFAALALKQGAPHVALESLSMQTPHYVTVRNIKAIALADIGRVDDALPILRAVMDNDTPEQKGKHTFFEETISKVRNAVEKAANKDIQKEFENIEKALRDRNLIDSQTLDQLLSSEITIVKKTTEKPRGMPRLPYGQRQGERSVEKTV
ncbi:unnamed protein product [Parnassius apollo]|uniref:(apollo) hypothetical protein n=1 Tax=Parnassius apollo TaxID=110799 RepID=A0A8S3Y4K6_PARAO|nr:unnamed protein product [Parnassius apollo]